MARARQWFMCSGNIRTAMQRQGAGPDLLLLHGLGCSSAYFKPLRRRLAGSFTVYAPDLPGHGRSAKPHDHMLRLRELTDWVATLIDELALKQPIVVGHSLGGGIAVDLGARYPHLVAKLALLAPTGVPEMPPLPGQLPLLLADGLIEPLRLYPLILPAYLRAGPRRILRLAIDQTRYGQRQHLGQVRAPVLVLRGARDVLVTDRAVLDIQAACRTVRVITLPQAAHALNVSHPQIVAEAITQFAAQPSRAALNCAT